MSTLVLRRLGIFASALMGCLAAAPRAGAQVAADAPAAGAAPVVIVVLAEPRAVASDLTLPASLQAFQDTPIYARTTGYIQKWFPDIGESVKAGQTLAILDGPELDQELNQARANLGQAKANLQIARISESRWKELGAGHAVSQQDVDQKTADLAAREAEVVGAQANVDRLTRLKEYCTVTAPYDGVVTARNAQIGALITAGSGVELYHLAQSGILRVYVHLPQRYVRSIRAGLKAEVIIPEFPSEVFEGKVVRLAGALEGASGTLLAEVQIPNAEGKLLPGMFGQVRFKLNDDDPAIVVPSNAAIIRAEGTLLATVDSTNRIRLVPVTLGRDFGSEIEILNGIRPKTRVVTNPSDSLVNGLRVQAVLASPTP